MVTDTSTMWIPELLLYFNQSIAIPLPSADEVRFGPNVVHEGHMARVVVVDDRVAAKVGVGLETAEGVQLERLRPSLTKDEKESITDSAPLCLRKPSKGIMPPSKFLRRLGWNIMIAEDKDCRPSETGWCFTIVLIDWETAGGLPDFWSYFVAHMAAAGITGILPHCCLSLLKQSEIGRLVRQVRKARHPPWSISIRVSQSQDISARKSMPCYFVGVARGVKVASRLSLYTSSHYQQRCRQLRGKVCPCPRWVRPGSKCSRGTVVLDHWDHKLRYPIQADIPNTIPGSAAAATNRVGRLASARVSSAHRAPAVAET
nr:hypothetical protein CFP56_53673 [Quercus suber]